MKKKSKVPFFLQIVPVVFPWIEKLVPKLANRFFVHLFFTPVSYKVPYKEKKAEEFAVKFTLNLNGNEIQCYRWGKGEKRILIIHGWAGRATQFRRFIKPLLNEGYEVIGFDGPAHGKSSGRSTNLDEFRYVIQALVKQSGSITAIIAHSFGGVAALYSISAGLPIYTVINIASPTLGDEIINTYLKAVKGSYQTGEAFKKYVFRKSGKTFNEFSSLEHINHVPSDLALLLIHDSDDREVTLHHPLELKKKFPQAELYQTQGLGHTRILRDENVIRKVVTFIQSRSSNS